MKRLRGALVGCGYISTAQLEAWAAIDEVEIIAVCDLDQNKAQAQAAKFGISRVYTDYKEMFNREELDFVDIATRPTSHLDILTAAAKSGIHILCQKPLTDSMPEAKQMVKICEDAGVELMVNENLRWQEWFRKIKSIIQSGEIGEPLYARFECRWRSTLPSADFEGQDFFGSMKHLIVYEMGIHYIDTCRYLFGEADKVFAVINRISPFIAGDDFALITYRFGNLTCSIDMNWFSVVEPRKNITHGHVRVEGEKGTIILDENGSLNLYTESGLQSWEFDRSVIQDSFISTQRHFVDTLINGIGSETSGEETINTLKLLFAAYLSGEEGRAVDLSEDFSQYALLPR